MDFYRRQGRQISGADFSDEFASVTLSYLVSVGTGIFDAMKEEVHPLSEADNDRGIRGFALSFRDSSSGLFVAPAISSMPIAIRRRAKTSSCLRRIGLLSF